MAYKFDVDHAIMISEKIGKSVFDVFMAAPFACSPDGARRIRAMITDGQAQAIAEVFEDSRKRYAAQADEARKCNDYARLAQTLDLAQGMDKAAKAWRQQWTK